MRFKRAFLLLIILTRSMGELCFGVSPSPLIGSWVWDSQKTLQEFNMPTQGSEELKKSAAKAQAFLRGRLEKLGSNMTLTYTDRECTEVIVDKNGHEMSRQSFPYKILKATKRYLIVDQPENRGHAELFLEKGSFYVEVTVGIFSYRDYFTKVQ